MIDQVRIMSANEYFRKYAQEGIGKGADRWMVRRQMLDDMKHEIFGMIALRTGGDAGKTPDTGDPEVLKVAKNVIKASTFKWKKICRMFDAYNETRNLIKPEDLKDILEIEEPKTE